MYLQDKHYLDKYYLEDQPYLQDSLIQKFILILPQSFMSRMLKPYSRFVRITVKILVLKKSSKTSKKY